MGLFQDNVLTALATGFRIPSLAQTGRVGVGKRPRKRGDDWLISPWVWEPQDISRYAPTYTRRWRAVVHGSAGFEAVGGCQTGWSVSLD